MSEERLMRLLRRRHMLMTKGGTLNPSEAEWLAALQKAIEES